MGPCYDNVRSRVSGPGEPLVESEQRGTHALSDRDLGPGPRTCLAWLWDPGAEARADPFCLKEQPRGGSCSGPALTGGGALPV